MHGGVQRRFRDAINLHGILAVICASLVALTGIGATFDRESGREGLIAAAVAPSISATPQQASIGSSINVSGAGFSRRSSGSVRLGTTTLASFTTDRVGAFSVNLTVPAQTPAGTQTLAATVKSLTAGTTLVVAAPATSSDVALGAWIPGAPWDPAQIDAFVQQIGRMPAIVHWYQGWSYPDMTKTRFNPEMMNAITSRGAMPLLTWEPWDYTAGAEQPAFALRTIAAGNHDAFIRQWARDAAAWGKPLYLRFAHEMNGNWYAWGVGANGNTSQEYVAAWRHVVDVFRQEGATNVRWVWCPNVHYDGLAPLAELYPGDAYVDWVAMDGYNWGTSQSWSSWQSFSSVFASSYALLIGLTSKPMMIAETSSAEAGGDKAAWITQGLLTDLPSAFPRVRAVVWFSENTPGQADWRVDSSQAALDAFRVVAGSAAFQGRLP